MSVVTDQEWPLVGCGPHESVALSSHGGDNCMPTEAHPTPPNGPVAATTADQAHLFEAYVQAFCELGEGQ